MTENGSVNDRVFRLLVEAPWVQQSNRLLGKFYWIPVLL